MRLAEEVSSRFLKKAAQKLLLRWVTGVVGDSAHGPVYRSFFASFCSQKEVLPSSTLSLCCTAKHSRCM
jgi:hypothetical protein